MRWKTSDPHRCGHVPDRRFKTKRDDDDDDDETISCLNFLE